MQFRQGDWIAHDYEVLEILGLGGMGEVYKVRNRVTHRIEALKLMHPDMHAEEELMLRFLREIRLHAELEHPRIVRLNNHVWVDRQLALLMEFVDGQSLDRRLLQEPPLTPDEVIRIGVDTCDGLAYAHRQRVIHRDLKPANILLGKDGRVKITDMGIARRLEGTAFTQSGVKVGSAPWMSPEQIGSGAELDARTDIYSLGVMLFELLSGKKPFGTSPNLDLRKRPAALRPSLGDVPEPLWQVIEKALQFHPKDRYQSAEDLGEALVSCKAQLTEAQLTAVPRRSEPPPKSPSQGEQPKPARSRANRLAVAAGALAVVGLAALAGFWKASGPANDAPGAPEPQAGETRPNPIDGLDYVWIPAGAFEMGCGPGDGECFRDEKPRHTVRLSNGYWMGKHEVTVEAYERFASAAGESMPQTPDFNEGWRKKDHPIVSVSWGQASRYCSWSGGRLPTEAEWERSARGGMDGSVYPWNREITPTDAKYGSADGTAPVGSYAPNGLGLHDLAGNVWEWCADWYDADYYRSSPGRNPEGPATGANRVARGGSWSTYASGLRCSARASSEPDAATSQMGFRCVREVSP